MNTLLLIFFAIPIAVIIISIALQKIFKCPFLVAAIIFAIFLVVTFVIGDLIFLVATIAYTILAFITALIVQLLCNENNNEDDDDDSGCGCLNNLLNTNNTNSNTNSSGCGCNRYRRF